MLIFAAVPIRAEAATKPYALIRQEALSDLPTCFFQQTAATHLWNYMATLVNTSAEVHRYRVSVAFLSRSNRVRKGGYAADIVAARLDGPSVDPADHTVTLLPAQTVDVVASIHKVGLFPTCVPRVEVDP